MKVCSLTTSDNPFCPIDEFEKWYSFDLQKNYNTSSYLARIARTSEQLSDFENNQIIEKAIDEIVKFDLISNETNGKVHYLKIQKEIE